MILSHGSETEDCRVFQGYDSFHIFLAQISGLLRDILGHLWFCYIEMSLLSGVITFSSIVTAVLFLVPCFRSLVPSRMLIVIGSDSVTMVAI